MSRRAICCVSSPAHRSGPSGPGLGQSRLAAPPTLCPTRFDVHAQCQPSDFPSNHSSAGRIQQSARLTSHFQVTHAIHAVVAGRPRSVRLHPKSKERHPICVCCKDPTGPTARPPSRVHGLCHQNHALSCMPLTCFVLAPLPNYITHSRPSVLCATNTILCPEDREFPQCPAATRLSDHITTTTQ